MAASAKNRTGKRKATGRSKKGTKRQEAATSGFRGEILLLFILAVAVILLASNFGVGGVVGDAISSFCFGAFGLMSYLFPIFLVIGSAFFIANRKSRLAQKKILAGLLLFLNFCGLIQLLTEGYMETTPLMEYFHNSAYYHTGGGLVGGALCISTTAAFGTIGAYAILILVGVVCLIIITQRSFFGFVNGIIFGIGKKAGALFERRETEPEPKRPARIRTQKEKQPKAVRPRKERRKSESTAEPVDFQIQRSEEPLEKESETSEDSYLILNPEEALVPEEKEEENTEVPARTKQPKSSEEEIASGIQNIQKEIDKRTEKKEKPYQTPPFSLLKRGKKGKTGDSDGHLRKTAQKLQETLHNFGVNVTITNVSCGPTVTRYELQPEQGVKVSRIVNLSDDIKLNLAASDIRIEAPIPGKAAVGIEVPNEENSPVMLRDLLQSEAFRKCPSKLAFAAGKDIAGQPVVADIAKMPHLLIAGATGSGKSDCINTLIMSILYKASPEEVKLIMIDPKVVELSVYNGIPHLFIPVVTDPKKAAGALNWAVSEMTSRYNIFAEYNVRNLEDYNKKAEALEDSQAEEKPEKLPQIVIIVDELADLMMVAPGEVEDAICRLAQLARAAGIHLIIATQRPSVNVITGLIKANMPSRIAFSVSSGVDSRTILDMNGAEKLLGKGDMLFYPQGYQKPARLQGAFVSDEEVSAVVEFLSKKHPKIEYNEKIEEQITSSVSPAAGADSSEQERDLYFEEAGRLIIEKEKASIGMLQRAFKIGFNRAARIMDQLAEVQVVGPEEGTKPRKVLMTLEEFEEVIK